MAQYFQYSQCSGPGALPLLSAALARLARSIGNSGSSAAPVSACPSAAMRLRREVRWARERAERSNSRSMVRMRFWPSRGQQLPGGLSDSLLNVADAAGACIEDREVRGVGGEEQQRRGVLRNLQRQHRPDTCGFHRPACCAPLRLEIEHPELGTAILVSFLAAAVHRDEQLPERTMDSADLLA